MELQLVAVLDDRGSAGGTGVQYQHPHQVSKPVVAPFWRDGGPARHDVLLRLRGGGRRYAGTPTLPPGSGSRATIARPSCRTSGSTGPVAMAGGRADSA